MEHIDETPTYPPKPQRPDHLSEDDTTSPEAIDYWNRFDLWVAEVQLLAEKAEQAAGKFEKIAADQAALDMVVFNLTRTFENPPPSTFCDYSELLDRNARILNAGFEYYLDKAAESPKADQKIRLAIQMQGQLVRTIDAWRRLENFLEGKRK